jgi:hypothetical protein
MGADSSTTISMLARPHCRSIPLAYYVQITYLQVTRLPLRCALPYQAGCPLFDTAKTSRHTVKVRETSKNVAESKKNFALRTGLPSRSKVLHCGFYISCLMDLDPETTTIDE